jgi:hypothetical protein
VPHTPCGGETFGCETEVVVLLALSGADVGGAADVRHFGALSVGLSFRLPGAAIGELDLAGITCWFGGRFDLHLLGNVSISAD